MALTEINKKKKKWREIIAAALNAFHLKLEFVRFFCRIDQISELDSFWQFLKIYFGYITSFIFISINFVCNRSTSLFISLS